MTISFAVIGGTGVYNPQMLNSIEKIEVATEFGDVVVTVGQIFGKKVAFLARHGHKHSVPPHLINYRANIMALKKLGVKKILATAAVGSINRTMGPGDFVLIDQFIDFTKSRAQTFYAGGHKGVLHIDMTEPYCSDLRKILIASCPAQVNLHQTGTYVCTEGPRFETPAEIKMFAKWGGDLVGMTSVPEVVLARELGMCYATIAMITNYGAGISETMLTHQEVVENMDKSKQNLQQFIMDTLINISEEQKCLCSQAYQEAGNLG